MKHDENSPEGKPNKSKKNCFDCAIFMSISLILILFFALLIIFFFFHFGKYKADIVLYNHSTSI